MRKIISVPILFLGALLLAPLAHGTIPIAASGTITPIQSLGDVIMVADGNTFFHHNDAHTLTGTLAGTTSEDVTIIVNLSTGKGTLSGLLFFTGTANGVSGTAVTAARRRCRRTQHSRKFHNHKRRRGTSKPPGTRNIRIRQRVHRWHIFRPGPLRLTWYSNIPHTHLNFSSFSLDYYTLSPAAG